MSCCANCFGDQYLEIEIFSTRSKSKGECSYCGAKDQHLLEPGALQEVFEPLIDIYEESADGQLLVERLHDDWAMFEDPAMNQSRQKDLMAEVLNNGEFVRKKFTPLASSQSDTSTRWAERCAEMKHENRFFPRSELQLDRIKQYLPYLRTEVGSIRRKWYRARMQSGDEAFPKEQMSAPPKHLAKHGRANPAGIPYLYVASDKETAVSEIRPHTGEIASVADFQLQGPLDIVDLRKPRKKISPFLLARDDVALNIGDIGFLAQCGQELTFPIRPQSAAFDYIPTQYLCEFLKDCEFHGVLYRSAVGEGINLALFEPDCAVVGDVTSVEVAKVSVELAGEQ